MLRACVVLLATTSACAVPLAMPPTRIDVGHGSTHDGGFSRVAIGAHLASIVPASALPVDVGGGLIFDSRSSGTGMTAQVAGAAVSDGQVTTTVALGKYVELEGAVHRTEHTRVLAGARYESFESGPVAHAAKLRVDVEALTRAKTTFAEADNGGGLFGGAFGNAGIGVYAEAGPAWFDDGSRGWTAMAGLTVRLPAWAALIWALPANGGCGG
jgi:hypothetical protein